MAIKNKVNLWVLAAAAAVIFLAIAAAVAGGGTQAADIEWSKAVYTWRAPVLTKIMQAVSSISSTPFTGFATAAVLFGFWAAKRRKTAFFFALSMLTSVIINNSVKYSLHRPRPDLSPIEDASFYSFPSGHTMNTLVFYGLLLYIARRSTGDKKSLPWLNAAAFIFVLLVGISRVYLGAHYPTDVIAGLAAGGGILMTAVAIEKSGKFKKVFSAE